MAWKIIAAIVGLSELLAPRTVSRLFLASCCENAEEVRLRGWVVTAIRIEGLVLLGWVLWNSREEITDMASLEDVPYWEGEEEPTPVEMEEAEAPTLQTDTTRFDLAAALYQADDSLPVSELVARSEGTDWQVGRSTASATLYRMHQDGLVERREREDARGFEYWLSDSGEAAVESVQGTVDAEAVASE